MNIKEKLEKNKLLIIVFFAYLILFIVSSESAIKALDNSVYYLIEMAQVLPVIFVLTVVIEAWIPKETIMKRLGEKSGVKGKIFSLALGSFSAGPIYAAFPIAKSLINKGASISNIVVILSAWAVIKVPMLVNEAKFLGPEFMVLRWSLTVIAILLMGYVTSKIVKKEDIPSGIEKKEDMINKTMRKKLVINEDYCIGCGLCAKMLPEYYEMDKGKAKVKKQPENKNSFETIKKTEEKCPVKAIIIELV